MSGHRAEARRSRRRWRSVFASVIPGDAPDPRETSPRYRQFGHEAGHRRALVAGGRPAGQTRPEYAPLLDRIARIRTAAGTHMRVICPGSSSGSGVSGHQARSNALAAPVTDRFRLGARLVRQPRKRLRDIDDSDTRPQSAVAERALCRGNVSAISIVRTGCAWPGCRKRSRADQCPAGQPGR